MTILTDEKILRTPCEDVELSEVPELLAKLEYELKNSLTAGVGLAAPQIGIFKKIFIIRVQIGKKFISLNCVNCKVDKFYDLATFKGEGCLSFPDLIVSTKRYNEIHVVNNLVAPHKFILTGYPSVIFQHEDDHLNGILLPDRALKV